MSLCSCVTRRERYSWYTNRIQEPLEFFYTQNVIILCTSFVLWYSLDLICFLWASNAKISVYLHIWIHIWRKICFITSYVKKGQWHNHYNNNIKKHSKIYSQIFFWKIIVNKNLNVEHITVEENNKTWNFFKIKLQLKYFLYYFGISYIIHGTKV